MFVILSERAERQALSGFTYFVTVREMVKIVAMTVLTRSTSGT
jgi:hypothetical protein